jgi:hypothetical protein
MHLSGEGSGAVVLTPIRRIITGTICGCALLIVSQSSSDAAGFSTNFQPTVGPGWSNATQQGSCTFGTLDCAGQYGNGDPTPFQQDLVTIGGQTYFHVIVGDPAAGFAEESYTPYGAGPNNTAGSGQVLQGDFSPTGGGNATSVIGNGNPLNASFLQNNMNMSNIFGDVAVSGSGSQSPSNVVFRMVLTSADGTMSMDVDKPFPDKKPIISQTIQDGTMSAVFVADMSALSYSDMNTPIKITNDLTISDPQIPAGSGDFEMALAQQPDITAGRYTFTPGTGWDTQYGWDSPNSTFGLGTYTYLQGSGFNPYTFDWGSVFSYDQNALNCARVALISGTSRNENAAGASCPGHP